MASTQTRILHPRFPLFSKIVVGFTLILLFMLLGSVFFLFQLGDVFTSGEAEFQNYQSTQQLDRFFNSEREAVIKFFETKDSSYLRTFGRVSQYFQSIGDSLANTTERAETRTQIQKLLVDHRRYVKFVNDECQRLAQNSSFGTEDIKRRNSVLYDSIKSQIQGVTDAYHISLTKSMKTFYQQAPIAIEGGKYALLLSFAIAFAIAIILARTLTKPIQALKAGTEKVGEGKYETVAVTTTDEVADLTRAFNLMSDKLRQLDEMRMQMMSEISHEMRTPLQVIKAGCYSVIHAKDGPPLTQRQRDSVAMIHQATNRINSFVNLFLDVAKMEAGLMKFNFAPLNLIELLTPLVQEAQLIAQTRQIDLEFQTQDLPSLSIDKERMSQVFSNLLSNALKYTPDGGRIALRLTIPTDCDGRNNNGKGCVRIEVQDSGVGIPEGDIPKLFDKFYQAKNVPLVNEKGSGLGLALVKHVTEAHGGRVSVKSKVGEGSTFTVELPA